MTATVPSITRINIRRTLAQFPKPLRRRLKEIARWQKRALSEVMHKAAKHVVTRFLKAHAPRKIWRLPTLDRAHDCFTVSTRLHQEVARPGLRLADNILKQNLLIVEYPGKKD